MFACIQISRRTTWQTELGEVNQIIALATQVKDLTSKLETTIALATSTEAAAKDSDEKPASGKTKGPWKMSAWRLDYQGDKLTRPDGTEYHWCKCDHWSGGEIKNGSYNRHLPGKHDEWRKGVDEQRRTKYEKTNTVSDASTTVVNDATKKKLALSEKLRTALTTQAGLSQEAFTRIWDESCKDSGNA